MKKIFLLVLISSAIYGCKSRATATNEFDPSTKVEVPEKVNEIKPEASTKNETINHLSDKHNNINRSFKTAQIISSLEYKDGSTDQSVKADIRIEKGKQILIVVKAYMFNVAKVYITPERISYYEIINGTHYDGDYFFFNKILGTKISYDQVENIFLGKALFDINSDNFELKEGNTKYVLDKTINDFVFSLVLSKNADLISESFNKKDTKYADLKYTTYQEVKGVVFPKKWSLQTLQLRKMNVNLEYNKIELNSDLNFKYEIPSGSKPVNF